MFKVVNIVVDVGFNRLYSIDELNKYKVLFIVEFKLLIDNYPLVEKLFKFVNIVVAVTILLLFGISKYDWVDKLFKFVLKLVFKLIMKHLHHLLYVDCLKMLNFH